MNQVLTLEGTYPCEKTKNWFWVLIAKQFECC